MITISLNPISVKVNGSNDKELLENAKNAVLETITKQFPPFSYTVDDMDVLTMETALPGQIVENAEGKIGIITARNKKTINVTYSNGLDVQGAPQVFKASNAPFEKARCPSNLGDIFFEGLSGYLKVDTEMKPVILGKKTGSKYRAFLINAEGKYYTLTETQLKTLFQKENE